MTSSCHRCLGLPTGLVPIGFQTNSLLAGLVWSILCTWPGHLILCALMNLTISAPSINFQCSMVVSFWRVKMPIFLGILTLEGETTILSETSGTKHPMTQHHTPEEW
jgi:hypothetical protein